MELKLILEAILFAAQKPMTVSELRQILADAAAAAASEEAATTKKPSATEVEQGLEALAADYADSDRSFHPVCVAGGWQLVSRPEFAPWVKTLAGTKARPSRLSPPALETLAIIAYRQPITRAEMEQIRGVSVDGVLQTLVERELVAQVGRAEAPGRPMTYGTTSLFLEYFGLRGLEDLPLAEELQRLPVERPSSNPAGEAGLATTPPESLKPEDNPVPEASAPGAGEPPARGVETAPEPEATNGEKRDRSDPGGPAPASG